jgi:hypothetical protein
MCLAVLTDVNIQWRCIISRCAAALMVLSSDNGGPLDLVESGANNLYVVLMCWSHNRCVLNRLWLLLMSTREKLCT